MIQIPDNSTILAPATLHLSLYKEILKQKKDCLGIQVLTLSSWLSSFYHGQTKSDIEILYLYKEALKNTSLSNAFYSSKEDYDFLNACLDFIKMAKTYQIHKFPCSTQKEKDLNEILNLLYPIQLKEDQTKDVLSSLPNLENVYILKKEYSQLDNYWIQVLMDHGAKWLGENQLCQTHYYSVANARKQMEVLANLIIESDYLADDIFVALNNESDEVELSLHPIAQIKFYDFLKRQANSKNLAIVISTHSSSLIKHADNRLFLEKNDNGVVSIVENCYPSYVLRSVSAIEDRCPDFVFFVEDEMAFEYLQSVVQKFLNDTHHILDYKIIPAGTYDQVIRITQSFPALSFEKRKVQAFLDKDAEDAFNDLSTKGNNRTDAENKKFDLFRNNHNYITYLSITPELGIWQWIEENPHDFKVFFDNAFGIQSFNMLEIISQTTDEENGNKNGNLRHWAKGCFKNFTEKINLKNPTISKENIIKCMIKCYVEHNYNLDYLKSVLCPILNR